MCFDEGKLLAYLDGEVTAEERSAIGSHRAGCAECAAVLRDLEADRCLTDSALRRLEPLADVVPLSRPPRPAAPASWRRYAAGAAAAAVLASFAFAPVRTAAADFLRVFRVQRVQTVSFSQQDLQTMSTALRSGSGHVDLKSLGEAWVDGGGTAAKTVTLAQAQQAVDFTVKLPAGAGEPKLSLQTAQTFKFKFNVSAVNAALRDYGSDRTFPESVDGKVFEVRVPAILTARYGETVPSGATPPEKKAATDASVFVGQARSPEHIVPEGVDPAELRDVLLNLPFLPKNVRDQLAAIDDWHSTLIIPTIDGTSRDIVIDGVPAVSISPDSAMRTERAKVGAPIPEHVTTIVWQTDGVVRAVGGPVDEDKAIALAKSCMR